MKQNQAQKLLKKRQKANKMSDLSQNSSNTTSDTSTDGKKQIGAFLTKKGAVIGAAIGTTLVVLGSVLEEQTGCIVGLFQVLKTWLGM